MEDSLVMRVVIFGTTFSLFVLGIAYWFISPKESEFFSDQKLERIAEFRDVRLTGRKEGHKNWTMRAASGWTDKSKDLTHLHNISEGKIFRDDVLVVDDLYAPRAATYRRSEIIEIFAEPAFPVKARINLGRLANPHDKTRREWSKLTCEYLKYYPLEKKTEIAGRITLQKRDGTIKCETIKIDNKAEIAEFIENVEVKRRDGIIRSKSMEYTGKTEQMTAKGSVEVMVEDGQTKTRIMTEQAAFASDQKQDVVMSGGLTVVQGKKIAVADQGTYSPKNKKLTLNGRSRIVFEKGRLIIADKTAKELKNDEVKESLSKKTVMTSDQAIISTVTGYTNASGQVLVTQKGKEAAADTAVYDNKSELITLTGNVSMKKSDKWVKAQKVVISVKNETFDASGQVEAEIKI